MGAVPVVTMHTRWAAGVPWIDSIKMGVGAVAAPPGYAPVMGVVPVPQVAPVPYSSWAVGLVVPDMVKLALQTKIAEVAFAPGATRETVVAEAEIEMTAVDFATVGSIHGSAACWAWTMDADSRANVSNSSNLRTLWMMGMIGMMGMISPFLTGFSLDSAEATTLYRCRNRCGRLEHKLYGPGIRAVLKGKLEGHWEVRRRRDYHNAKGGCEG